MLVTKSKRFEVRRYGRDGSITLYHRASGLPCGGFSHIAVRTMKAALEGVEEAEAQLTPMEWHLIDGVREDRANDHPELLRALGHWQDELRRAFPLGGWSR